MLVRQNLDAAKDATELLLQMWEKYQPEIHQGWEQGQHGSGNLLVAEVSILRARAFMLAGDGDGAIRHVRALALPRKLQTGVSFIERIESFVPVVFVERVRALGGAHAPCAQWV